MSSKLLCKRILEFKRITFPVYPAFSMAVLSNSRPSLFSWIDTNRMLSVKELQQTPSIEWWNFNYTMSNLNIGSKSTFVTNISCILPVFLFNHRLKKQDTVSGQLKNINGICKSSNSPPVYILHKNGVSKQHDAESAMDFKWFIYRESFRGTLRIAYNMFRGPGAYLISWIPCRPHQFVIYINSAQKLNWLNHSNLTNLSTPS